MTGTFWAVTGEFTRWGGHVLQWFGLHPEQWGYFKVIGLQGTPLERIDGRMIIGMFAGCIAAALWANNIATPAAAPHSHRAGAAGRHYRRLRRAPGDGL